MKKLVLIVCLMVSIMPLGMQATQQYYYSSGCEPGSWSNVYEAIWIMKRRNNKDQSYKETLKKFVFVMTATFGTLYTIEKSCDAWDAISKR